MKHKQIELQDLILDNRRLRQALKRYGVHEIGCKFIRLDSCDCGLDKALAGKKERK